MTAGDGSGEMKVETRTFRAARHAGRLVQVLYDHGGSRIYYENVEGRRNLIADTYGAKANADYVWHELVKVFPGTVLDLRGGDE